MVSLRLEAHRMLVASLALAPWRFLFSHYRPGCYYFEVVECGRRLLFMSGQLLPLAAHVSLGALFAIGKKRPREYTAGGGLRRSKRRTRRSSGPSRNTD